MKDSYLKWLAVGVGGMAGALARYEIGLWVMNGGWTSEYATLPINWIDCLCLGLFKGLTDSGGWTVKPWVSLAVGTGFFGSFTTFSAFSLECMRLLLDGRAATAVLYLALSVAGGLALAWLGLRLPARHNRRNNRGSI